MEQQWTFRAEEIEFDQWKKMSDSVLNANAELIISTHNLVRDQTDLEKNQLIPGTEEFTNALNDITSKISYLQGGTGFYDKSALNHIHGE